MRTHSAGAALLVAVVALATIAPVVARTGPHRDHDQGHRRHAGEPHVESRRHGLLRQHDEGDDLSRRAGRRAGRAVDSRLGHRSDSRARRARRRQGQHAVGLPERHRGPGRSARAGQTALRSFDLKTGAAKGTYPFPANSGVCNDIAVSADGSAYASESFRGRVHRLKPGATALEVWVTDPAAERHRRSRLPRRRVAVRERVHVAASCFAFR